MRHILRELVLTRDPGSRHEAMSFCGLFEECSGSGKHSFHGTPVNDDVCQKCKEECLKYSSCD